MSIRTTAPPPPASYPHIESDERGILRVAGTGYKVVELLSWYRARRWSEDEFLAGFPSLTRAQLHSLLAYYYDHQLNVDEEIDRRAALAEDVLGQVEGSQQVSQLQDRLRRARPSAT
jgi:uncharacterized protein (DUF433 family)